MSVHPEATEDAPGASEPLLFHPKRAPTGWRRYGAWAHNAALALMIVLLAIDGVGLLLGIALAMLASALLLSAYGTVQRHRGKWDSRYDERETVVLPGELVDRVRRLRAEGHRSEAFNLVRREAQLGFDDTVRVLELIERTAPTR